MTSSCTQDCRGLLQLTPTVMMTPCTSHQLVLGPDIKTNDCSQCTHLQTVQGFVFVECGRKLERPARTQADTGRTCKLHTERSKKRLGIKPTTYLLGGKLS